MDQISDVPPDHGLCRRRALVGRILIYSTITSGEVSWTAPGEAWRFSLWAKNITNVAVFQTLRPGALGTDAIFDQPREVGLGVVYKF